MVPVPPSKASRAKVGAAPKNSAVTTTKPIPARPPADVAAADVAAIGVVAGGGAAGAVIRHALTGRRRRAQRAAPAAVLAALAVRPSPLTIAGRDAILRPPRTQAPKDTQA